ncbi:MAG: hypothetical protein NTV21_17350 [Planctomycetota bacterium]|nr:hypothetical protein [Planctomycetota bacterium]
MRPLLVLVPLGLCGLASAQWNPPAAQWGKQDARDLRVMSWNVQDALCSTNAKVEGANNWTACARVIAALRPDVVFLSECADNSGNGTGSNVDSVVNLTTTLDDFLHGGTDSFHGNTPVTAWVQKYAPGYDLPFVYVSGASDGFNRNVVLSRFPFADLNGDGSATRQDIPGVTAAAWAPGGNGGIRGFLFTEIDLPNASYAGNLVLGGAHLKAGSNGSDHTQRVTATQNVSYVVQYWWNGAQTSGGTVDGTDRDGTDMSYDASVHPFSGNRQTIGTSGTKFDYIAWQDSIATLRLSSVFDSGSNPAGTQPAEFAGYAGSVTSLSSVASDHRPVLADLVLPAALVDCNANGIADALDIANGSSHDTNGNAVPDECEPCASVIVYCTAGTTSSGCVPSIAALGVPSASAPSGFTLVATGVEGQKSGLLFYGTSGAKASVWAPSNSSVLCVKSPTQRTGSQSSGGTAGACDGALTLDLAAWLSAHPAALGQPLVAGEFLWCQGWFRDPLVSGTTQLTNALQARLCP